MAKKRSFTKSNVNVENHLKDQAEVEKSLKLRRDYEENFQKLQDSFLKLIEIASPYANKVDFKACLEEKVEKIVDEYHSRIDSFISSKPNPENRERMAEIISLKGNPINLKVNFNAEAYVRNFLISDNNWEKIKLFKVINSFLDAYENVLNMDTRTPGEKATGTKEYINELRNNINKKGVEAVNDIAKDAFKTFTNNIPSAGAIQEGVNNAFTEMSAAFRSVANYVTDFLKSDDQKEIEKDLKEQQEEAASVQEILQEINEESAQEDSDDLIVITISDETDNAEVTTIGNYIKPNSDAAIKISDSKTINNWHKQFQDKLSGFIDTAKVSCFASAVKMNEEANKCELQSIAKSSEECTSLKKSAKFLMENCDAIFPMQSNYDEMITKMLDYAIDARVSITESGDMKYIAVGELISKDSAYRGTDVTSLPMPQNAGDAGQNLLPYNNAELSGVDSQGDILAIGA